MKVISTLEKIKDNKVEIDFEKSKEGLGQI